MRIVFWHQNGRLAALILWAALALSPQLTLAQSRPLIVAESQRETWQAVGQINQGQAKSGGCTGTLIAPDLVLTAAHCVVQSKTQKILPLYRIQFVAGWHSGEHNGSAKAKAVRLHPDYLPALKDSKGSHSWATLVADLALIELAEPLAGVVPAKITDRPVTPGSVAVLGYAHHNVEQLSDYVGCQGAPVAPKIIGLTCAVRSGVSGGPVLQRIDEIWQLVGVVSASGTKETKPIEGFAVFADQSTLEQVFFGE